MLDSVMEEVLCFHERSTDLLVLARTRTGTVGPRPEVDLGEVAESVIDSVRRSGSAGTVEIWARGHAVVRGDAPALQRAVTNLVAR